MATITFDTLKFARRLKDAGVPEKQAEAEAEALSEVFETNTGNLATKDDMALLRKDLALLKKDFDNLRAETASDLKLLKWMMALVIATTVIPALKNLFF